MIDVDCICTGLATWRRRWPHLVLISLEVHPATLQSLGIAHVNGLPLEAASWLVKIVGTSSTGGVERRDDDGSVMMMLMVSAYWPASPTERSI